MSGRLKKSSPTSRRGKALDRPFDADVLRQAQEIAGTYGFVVQPAAEVGYVGRVLEMPGVMADGPSPEECLLQLREAAVAAVATLLERGQAPPLSASQGRRTSQINIRVSEDEKILLEEAAKRKGFRGVSDFIRTTTLSSLR